MKAVLMWMLLCSFESQESEVLRDELWPLVKMIKKIVLDQLQNVKSWLTEQFKMEDLLLLVVRTEEAYIQL